MPKDFAFGKPRYELSAINFLVADMPAHYRFAYGGWEAYERDYEDDPSGPLDPPDTRSFGDGLGKDAAGGRHRRGISRPLDLLAFYPLARRSRTNSDEATTTNMRANMIACTGSLAFGKPSIPSGLRIDPRLKMTPG